MRALICLGLLAAAVYVAGFKLPALLHAQATTTPPTVVPMGSLKGVPTPTVNNLGAFLKTDLLGNVTPQARAAAIALGKALFWDQAAGSDGQACASCHFNAGADSRTKNQLNPGFRAIPPDNNFEAGFSANYQLTPADFPFHTTRPQSNDIVSSQGVFNTTFLDITLSPCPADQPALGAICDTGSTAADPVFDANGRARRVEPRNTPTMINAVFNFRNFWDGRARNEFNGVDPIGDLDPFARVLISPSASSPNMQKIQLTGNFRLENSALASQSVGPPLSDLEMSFAHRTFAKLGKKMLALKFALTGQLVAPDDSVFFQWVTDANGNQVLDPVTGLPIPGSFPSKFPTPAIARNYASLIQAAFQTQWWKSNQVITFGACSKGNNTTVPSAGGGDPTICFQPPPPPGTPLTTNQFTQMEYNFSLFWGIAVQMYESTLRADDSPFDRAFDTGNPSAFTQSPDANGFGTWGDAEKLGLDVFQNKGKCVSCHGGPETTNASVRNVASERLERMLMGNDLTAVYDNGFYNTAVTRCAGNIAGACDDIGIGATIGPNNLPLSTSRFFQLPGQCGFGTAVIDGVTFTGCVAAPLIRPRPAEGIAFNLLQPDERVAVDGAFKTSGLRNVELTAPYFHNGGDLSLMDVVNFYDRGGNFAAFNQDNFDPNINVLGLTDAEKNGLVALLKAMTDDRVRYQKKPFDHPQLFVPNLGTLPAVGASGSATPLHTFLDNLQNPPAKP
ncbi:MAG TPA: cytochrome c peroxidase [Candidatus Angelobacter sp.]|nr:cytochrome c peroxidase [Candidatus Angelobacter sp.]